MNCSKLFKISFLLGLLAIFTASLSAEFVSAQQGLQVAENWLSHWQNEENLQIDEIKRFKDNTLEQYELREDSISAELPELYIYYFTNGKFAVVPCDDNLPPVLAYSSLALEDKNDIPPAFSMWLQQYAGDVAGIRNSSYTNRENQKLWQEISRNEFHSNARNRDVEPLLKTTWNQDWPYNELCPTDPAGPGGRVYVGCVATAMAQVMKYWNKPITGQGSSSYYAYGYGYQSANYGNTTYLWDEMPNSLSGSNIPVATLMYHAAVSVEMGFSPDGSGSNGMRAQEAFQNYFRFPGASYQQKQNYSASAWESILREQIDNGVPMYYSGSNTDSGHAWNCDGYQGTNYFHFNFGWSGSYNGYYYLNSVNPGSNTFNLYQAAITNTIPEAYTITQPRIRLEANPPTAGDPFSLAITTYPIIADWSVDEVNLSLYFDNQAMQYRDYDLSGTIAAGGDMQVVDTNDGYLHISYSRDTPLFGAGDLFKINFQSIEPGNFYFGPVDMMYNGQILQNVEPLIMDVVAPVATLADSQISLTNAMHIGYNEIGTMNVNTTYLPPSWNVTEVNTNVHFDASKIEFVALETEGTLLANATNVQFEIPEDGVAHISCTTTEPISGNQLPLLKLSFRAIGNTSSTSTSIVTFSDFYYNQTLINNTSNGIFVLAAVTGNDDNIQQPGFSVDSYPNPFNPSTTIVLNTSNTQPVKAAIYNLKGQLVSNLYSGILSTGEHNFVWHGTDMNGKGVANGVYLLRVTGKHELKQRKLSLMK
jgi:hypothetical protein